jgi:arsenate reductase-like glutaredoxin family protein
VRLTALQAYPKRRELFSSEQQTRLDSIVHECGELAKLALRYWLRIVRWKTRIPYLGETEIADEESGRATYLTPAQSNRGFWASTRVINLRSQAFITDAQWHATQLTLNAAITPPAWFDFIFEALQRFNNKDIVAAVISAAIGFEMIMRNLVALHLSLESAQQQIVTKILDQSNVRFIMNHIKEMKIWDEDLRKVFDSSAFNDLMNCRDAIMHRGDVNAIKVDLHKIFHRLLDFAYLVDERICNQG